MGKFIYGIAFMKINILLPNFANRPSGGHRIAYQYANGLVKKGHSVTLVFSSGKRDAILNRLSFFAMCILIRFTKKWFKFNSAVKIKYVFNLNEKCIPNADATIATAYQTTLALEKCGINKGKKIYLIQHYETWLAPKEVIDETWKYNDMTKIVISKYLKTIGENLGVFDTVYIPNSIDCNLFKLTKNIQNRKYDLAMMYSNQEIKGCIYGLRAVEIIKKKNPDFNVIFFGIESRSKDIPKWINYVKNPSQEFLANDIYNNSSIYLCSSISEGWSLPPMEAMACGTAVVTTQNGGISDFCIDGENALICEVKNSEQMAKCIEKLYLNINLRDVLVKNGLKKIEEFSFETSLNKLNKVLET